MPEPSVVCSQLSFSWPDETPVFDQLSFTVGTGRTGLVAPNGAGKSTLLRLIAGELRATAGTVSVHGLLGYLPQQLPLRGDLSVAEVLGIAKPLAALRAIESGDARERHFAAIGNDWDVESRARVELDRLGLGELAFDRRLATLSGGEVIALGLAAQLRKHPDVLLLDEPTNNLDAAARDRLTEVLASWAGCLLVVSHDRTLLSVMDRIAELSSAEVRLYGGDYRSYRETVTAEQELAEQRVRSAQLALKREKRDRQQARERAARRAGNAARHVADAGLPKIVAGTLKRRAQESAGKSDDTQAARENAARRRLDAAARELRDEPTLTLELPHTAVPAGRTLFAGEELHVRYGARAVFAGGGIDLTIRGPERLALTGRNGAGKSTLLRLISGELEPDGGTVRRAGGRVAYLAQRLDVLDPDRTVAGNFATWAPGMLPAERLNVLARFLFRGAAAHLPVGLLSGGERLRATLACVLHAEPAPHLLLLDEPTNNLDLTSVNQLESALNAYRGAIVAVSHDAHFLTAIGIGRWLALDAGRLVEHAAPAGLRERDQT